MSAGLIILAGGASRRMGRDKSLLVLGGEPMIRRIVRRLSGWPPLIVANKADPYTDLGIPVIPDRFPGQGPLAGLHAGLRASRFPLNLVVACDLPFASPDLARFLFDRAGDADAVVPRTGERVHPLFAVYHRRIIPALETCLLEKERKVRRFLNRIRTRYVDEEILRQVVDPEKALFNLNRPEDFRRAKDMEET